MNSLTDKLATELFEHAVNRARDVLSDVLEDDNAGEREVRRAAIDLCAALNALDDAQRTGSKEVPVCAYCGSTDVSAEALSTYWDVSEQEWKVSDICDKGHYCNACDGETRLSWRQATPEEAA